MSQSVNNDPAGILLVDKPQGITSHDVVARMRRVFQIKKIGHAGVTFLDEYEETLGEDFCVSIRNKLQDDKKFKQEIIKAWKKGVSKV